MSFYIQPPKRHTVRYFYPYECDYESTECSDERIKNICKNNVSEGREEDFPTDPISGEEIKPPFLKGLHYGEERDRRRKSSGTVSRMARLYQKKEAGSKWLEAGVGKCYNDGVIDNGLRTWNQTKKTDPLTRNKMEKMPPRLTKEQIDLKHLESIFLPNTPYNIIEKGVKGLAKNMVNPEGMKAMLRYPFFLDLDKKGIEASASIAEQRLTHEPENTFYKGWLKVMVEGDAREGFEMMRFECNFSEKNMEDFKKLVMNHEY
jgi:hypothetical protein